MIYTKITVIFRQNRKLLKANSSRFSTHSATNSAIRDLGNQYVVGQSLVRLLQIKQKYNTYYVIVSNDFLSGLKIRETTKSVFQNKGQKTIISHRLDLFSANYQLLIVKTIKMYQPKSTSCISTYFLGVLEYTNEWAQAEGFNLIFSYVA